MLLVLTLLNEPEIFCAPEVIDVLTTASADAFSIVRAPDVPVIWISSNAPEILCAPDVEDVLSVAAVDSVMLIAPEVQLSVRDPACTFEIVVLPEVAPRLIVSAFIPEIVVAPDVARIDKSIKSLLIGYGSSISSLLLGILPTLFPSVNSTLMVLPCVVTLISSPALSSR